MVDTAILDGSAHMLNLLLSARNGGMVSDQKGQSIHDSSPFYETYVCADGHHITVGSIEPQFYALLLSNLGLQDDPQSAASLIEQATVTRSNVNNGSLRI